MHAETQFEELEVSELMTEEPVIHSQFAEELERCIVKSALRMAEAFPTWGNSCMAPTSCGCAQTLQCPCSIYREFPDTGTPWPRDILFSPWQENRCPGEDL